MENVEQIRLPWPDWKIVKYLGGGAYGKVYEIERNNSGIQEKAAVKIVSRPKEESELEVDYQNGYDRESIAVKYTEILQEYKNEYKLMKELQGQSNIVSCDDFAIEENPDGIGGKIYIRMELLTPLQKVTKERLLSEKEVIKLGKDICKALILCESRNIIHRDIKPDNIMISKFGDYKLGDFGVSKIMSHTTGATMTGTEGYMAPEVLHIEKYGKEVDIYSLGIVMYWLLNNRRMPFIGADEKVTLVNANQAAIRRYQGEKIPAPKNGSNELKKIVLKACEYKPKDRYLTAQEMHDALEEIGSGKPYTKNTVSGYQAEPSSYPVDGLLAGSSLEDDWMESSETVGKTLGGFSGGQTAGNSWGGGGTIGRTIARTIGKLKGNTEKKQKEVQEEPKTIGVKKAYQEQKKKLEKAKVPKQPKEPEQPKVLKQQRKDAGTGEVIAKVSKPKYKRTTFGYVWNIFVIGCCVAGLLVGQTKEWYIPSTFMVIFVLIIEIAILFKEVEKDIVGVGMVNLFLFMGGIVKWAFSANTYLKSWQANILVIAGLIWVFVIPIVVTRFSITEINEPVEKNDNKPKIAKYKQIKVVVIIVVTVIYGVLVGKNIELAPGSIDRSNYEENVDDNGNVIQRTYYYNSGDVGEIEEYDGNGKMTKKTHYETNGKSISSVYEYNENGEEIKWSRYANGKMSSYYTYEYDEKGNKIKETHYDREGQLEEYEIYEYDSDNTMTKITYYDPDGNVKQYSIYEKGKSLKRTTYDANGNVISESK